MAGALDYLGERLDELRAQGLLLHERVLGGPTGARARFDGREVINLASNNYLGLANHPRMNDAAARAASTYGAGTGAVRTIAGTMAMHRDLERRFAAFKRAEDALMFQSGFTANAGTVAAILDKEDVIVSDQLNHASIIDGARLSRAEIKVFRHKDAAAAGRLLEETKAPGRRHLVDWLVNRGRPFLFSTSAPPPAAAACIAALDILESEPERVKRLWERTRYFKSGLESLGFDTGASETPITPVIAGEDRAAQELSRLLWEEGVFSPPIVFPTVAKGRARVRTIVTSEHTEDDLREALDAFERVGRKLGLL